MSGNPGRINVWRIAAAEFQMLLAKNPETLRQMIADRVTKPRVRVKAGSCRQ